MTFLLFLTFSSLLCFIQNEEISRHEFLADELEQKLELLKHDIQSIEKFVHASLLYQNDLDNSTEAEYEYEDYGEEPVEEEDYNYEYNYEDYEGSTDGTEEVGETSKEEETKVEEVVTESSPLPNLVGRQMKAKGSKRKKKAAKKGKKKNKSKKQKKGKKKGKKVKKQKGLSVGTGNTRTTNMKKTRGISLTPEQVREICSAQPARQSGGQAAGASKPTGTAGWRGINQGGPSNPNQFAEQFKQLTQSFSELQSALQSFRKSSGSVPTGSSNEPSSTENRDTVAGQDSEVGPLVQAALGAQSAAANALRGLLPSGQKAD